MSTLSEVENHEFRRRSGRPPTSAARTKRHLRFGLAALLVAFAGLVLAAPRHAAGQDANAKPEPKGDPKPEPKPEPKPAKWTILFLADDPSLWDTNTKGKAIPLKYAPAEMRYLRLRRIDTFDALILPLTRDELTNGKPPESDNTGFWWNGTAKEDWKGRHLGIVQGPRHKFPAPRGMIGVMTENWDAFTGSGFGHKCFVNDKQYYCWRGKEIRRTVFEIAVSEGPLSDEDKRLVLPSP